MACSSSSASTANCPVDHSSQRASCPVDHNSSKTEPTCPVDHSTQSNWDRFHASSTTRSLHVPLSQDREVSSIPKTGEGKWVYPSEAQFFAAMARKHHNPNAADMRSIVPIHNAVNERAWSEILSWEAGKGGDACGGVKLVNFKGRPGDRSPKAQLNTLLGYFFFYVCSPLINLC
jgi:cytochrome c heme-lyase